jgi:hypothetical protein
VSGEYGAADLQAEHQTNGTGEKQRRTWTGTISTHVCSFSTAKGNARVEFALAEATKPEPITHHVYSLDTHAASSRQNQRQLGEAVQVIGYLR